MAVIFFLQSQVAVSQIEFRILNNFRHYNLDSINYILSHKRLDPDLEMVVKWKYENLVYGTIGNFPVEVNPHSPVRYNQATATLFYGDYLSENGAAPDLSYHYYLAVKDFAEKNNDELMLCEALKRMVGQINIKEQNYPLLLDLSNEYRRAAFDQFEKDQSRLYYVRAKSLIDTVPYIEEFLSGLKESKKNKNYLVQAMFHKLLGVKYEFYSKYLLDNKISSNNYQKSIRHYDSSLVIYNKYPFYFSRKNTVGILLNKGINYHFQKKYDSAHFFYDKMKELTPESDKTHLILYDLWSARTFEMEGHLKRAISHRVSERNIRNNVYREQTDLNIAEINTKYQTAEKEKQILIEQKQKTKNRNIAYGLGGASGLIALIGFLLFKNTKRKQHIAEQQREIEIRKIEKLLKEQELTTIDAMIAGQEKERERLASDLHDSVGAKIAAARLQFDGLKDHKGEHPNEKELFKNVSNLIKEVQEEVRSLAHLKNSGVIAKNGLLPAVEKLAKNASGTNKLIIEVQDFGLDNRLENSLEINIFRIIQELVTNIIKHANASEASISITQHDDSLSIIVEDNGQGFDPRKLPKKEGMGLASIEKRIEHLEGTMEVDSTPGQGTSVLIDIPL